MPGVSRKVQSPSARDNPFRVATRWECENRQNQAASDALIRHRRYRERQMRQTIPWIMTLALIGLTAAPYALAQNYPIRPVRVITLTAAGGSLDIMARTLAQSLSESMGQQFYVENKVGAGGNLGVSELGWSAPRLHYRDDHGLHTRHQSESLR